MPLYGLLFQFENIVSECELMRRRSDTAFNLCLLFVLGVVDVFLSSLRLS